MFNATSMGLKLSFGKHKGRTIADVIKSDAQYILWLKHSNIMSFADHILMEAEAKNKPRTYSYRSGYSYSRYTKKKRKAGFDSRAYTAWYNTNKKNNTFLC